MSLTADIISEDGLSYFVKTHIFCKQMMSLALALCLPGF